MNENKTSGTHEQRYRVLIDNAPEVVLILDAETGRFIDFNKNALHLFQLSGEELLSKGPVDLSPPTVYGHPASDHSWTLIQEALQGANPVFQWIHLDSKGREIPCEIRLIRFPPYDRQLVRASIIDMTDRRKMERALAESEERLKLALSSSGLGCFDWQPADKKLHWDEQMHRLFGLPMDSKVDLNDYFSMILHPEDKERVLNSMTQSLDATNPKEPFEDEYRIIRNGEVRYILVHGYLFVNERGEIKRVIGTCQDVTPDRTRENLLRATTEALEEAQRIAKLGNFKTDLLNRTTWWSKGMYQIFETTPGETVPSRKYYLEHVHPDDRERIDQMIDTCIKQGIEQKLEYRLQLENGRIKYMDDTIRPVSDAKGRVTGLVGTSQDITRRKEAEKALRVSEAHYRALAENFPNGLIALFDHDLRYSVVNGQGLAQIGLRPEDLQGKQLREVFPPEIYQRDEPALQAALRGATTELVVPFGDNFFSVTTLPVKDEQGSVIQGMVMSQNITGLKLVEAELKKTLQQLQLSIETAKLGIWRLAPETGDLIWNDQLLKIYGLTREAFNNNINGWQNQIHPDDKDHALDQLGAMFAGKNVYDVAFRILRPTGEVRYINASGGPMYDETGKVVELTGINIDVTHIKKKEEALREHEAFLQAIFDNSLNPIVVADDDGVLRSANQAAARMFGCPVDSILGRNLTELELSDGSDPGEIFQAFLSKGQEIGEFTFIRTDGTKGAAQFHAVRVDENFNLSMLVDFTERKRAEDNLKQAQRELSEITERLQVSTGAAQVGIWDWNVQTDNLLWDETMYALYGITEADFSGSAAAWREHVHPEDREKNKQAIVAALKGEKEFNTEFRVIWPDQSVHFIKALATVQRDAHGAGVRMIGTNWDITKEKEAERQKIRARQLELKNKELEQFAYVASHDLQEPLRTVIGFVELLKRSNQDKLDEKSNQYLQFISQAAYRMSKLIKGLLEYSHIGQNRELTSVDCQALVNNLLKDLNARITENQAIVEVGPLPALRGYETELQVLFQNLISNALKFRRTEVTPFIQVAAKKGKDYWQFSITDNGIGIAPKYQEKIFVIFQRLHPRNKYEGTGIGLAHCQKIVDLHGGKIWVDSQPGTGSTFHFTIPDLNR